MNHPKWIKYFLYSAGAILLLAGVERFLILAQGGTAALSSPEPILGIPLRYAIAVVGALELVGAGICLFSTRFGFQTAWLGWLVANFGIYRVALLACGYHQQGSCMGIVTDPLQLAHGFLGSITNITYPYLLVGSITTVVVPWVSKRRSEEITNYVKTACPACGVHIRFERERIGQNTNCPRCQKSITLRGPELLKTTCFYCKGHIQFPAHALGEKIKCPHCDRSVVLRGTPGTRYEGQFGRHPIEPLE